MSLDSHIKKHCKRCPGGCRRWVNKAVLICGECVNQRTMKAIAVANNVNLGEKLHKGWELSAEAKKNIGAANRRKADLTGGRVGI